MSENDELDLEGQVGMAGSEDPAEGADPDDEDTGGTSQSGAGSKDSAPEG